MLMAFPSVAKGLRCIRTVPNLTETATNGAVHLLGKMAASVMNLAPIQHTVV